MDQATLRATASSTVRRAKRFEPFLFPFSFVHSPRASQASSLHLLHNGARFHRSHGLRYRSSRPVVRPRRCGCPRLAGASASAITSGQHAVPGSAFQASARHRQRFQPYPAVDALGNTSGGLAPSGSQSAGCNDKNKAQIYSRSGTYNGAYGIMYSWYMPKDSPSTGLGHRHDWENIVVWLDSSNAASATIVAAAASAHGEYKKSYPISSSYVANGVSTKINYKSTWPVNHELGFTTTAGAAQPLIQWEQLTAAAQNALETTDFGSATVPFKSNFQANLASAYYK